MVRSSPDTVHAEIGFSRHGADGTAYRTSRVFYIVTFGGSQHASTRPRT